MINTVGVLLHQHKGEFSLAFTANTLQEKQQELSCRVKNLIQQGSYVPKVVFKDDNTLSVECSPAKCLYGNNVYEVSSGDLKTFVDTLTRILDQLGISVRANDLYNAHCWRIDYAKETLLPCSADEMSELLMHSIPKGRMKKSVTVYVNQGRAIADSLSKRRAVFYDKKQEFLSDKHNKDENLKTLLKSISGSLWRFEFSMKTAKEIKRELGQCGYGPDVRLSVLFNHQIAQAVLTRRFEEFKASLIDWTPKQAVCFLRKSLPSVPVRGLRDCFYKMTIILLVSLLGVNTVSSAVAQCAGERAVCTFKRDVRAIRQNIAPELPDCIKKIQESLRNMQPVTDKLLQRAVPSVPSNALFLCLNAPVLLALIRVLLPQLAQKMEGDL
ncbi:MAG: hypothetical protein PUC11_05145 [Elusimicrobia bacterium]|nr:hypothetical protein [Elusimicrobiota bacterium]